MAKITKGTRVRIVIDPPNGQAAEGTVVVLGKEPGKAVGVELDRLTDRCHSLDGLVEERVDETRGVTVGKGYWTLPENVEVLQLNKGPIQWPTNGKLNTTTEQA